MADYQGKPPSLGYGTRSTGRPQALGLASESRPASNVSPDLGPYPTRFPESRERTQYDDARDIRDYQREKRARESRRHRPRSSSR